jgi:hypothetical protein
MIEEIDAKNPFSGFPIREQELKYNTTVFDLMTTLAARVTASLKLCKEISLLTVVLSETKGLP